MFRREAIEMLLTKETGLTRRDIRGWKETTVRTERRTDIIAKVKEWWPWCYDVPKIETAETTNVPGMQEKEIMRYLILHDEHEVMKEEEMEKEQKRARRKAGGLNGK